MDVKSLYTVIPNDCGLQALAYFLDKRDIKEPSTSTLTRLAELVLTLNSFSFNNEYYRQLGGVAMGSRMGPNYACLFVGYVEQQIREQYTGFIPQLHKRYIDDIVGAASCRRDELEDFIALTLFLTSTQHFNSHQLLPKRNYLFSISTCAFLKIEFKPLSSTRKRILTTTSISLLFILITASVLSLTASSSAFVDFAQTMMTSRTNLGR